MPGRRGTGIALLADPTRRRIVSLVAVRPLRASIIADRVGLSRPATSHHLRLLREAGLVRPLRFPHDGRAVLYGLDPRTHGFVTAWLAGTEVGLPHRGDADAKASEDDVEAPPTAPPPV